MKKSRLFMLWMAVLIALLLLGIALIAVGAVRGKPQGNVLKACIPLLPALG